MVAEGQDNTPSHHSKRVPPNIERFNPRSRPLDYRGSQGWATRIATRTLYGAAAGAVAGLGIGIVKRQNPFRWFTSVGANCAVATFCFCGFQEFVRELRAADPGDWVNCLLGGLASGALLGRLHGGPTRALPGAVLFASVGTGLHIGAGQLMEYRLQHFLASVAREGVDDIEPSVEARPLELESKTKRWSSWEFPEWFPIRKLDEEAVKKKDLKRNPMLKDN